MNYTFRHSSHPEANGRQPQEGDELFSVFHDTDEGGKVTIELGRKGLIGLASMILRILRDDPVLLAEVEAATNSVEHTIYDDE